VPPDVAELSEIEIRARTRLICTERWNPRYEPENNETIVLLVCALREAEAYINAEKSLDHPLPFARYWLARASRLIGGARHAR
jgi:hypothetical protein